MKNSLSAASAAKELRMEQFTEFMSKGLDAEVVELLRERLDEMEFFEAPASSRFHGAYTGGLFDHSMEVAKALVDLTEKLNLTWSRAGSPYLVGMLHDICKCDEYMEIDGKYERVKNLLLTGHGDKSVILIQRIMSLNYDEMLCVRWHMGAFDDSSLWNSYGAAIEAVPNVLYAHTADMIASRIKGV